LSFLGEQWNRPREKGPGTGQHQRLCSWLT
jgi:hypothetical protein